MSEMVERVALALYAGTFGFSPDEAVKSWAEEPAFAIHSGYPDPRGNYLRMAQNAITAMREPTDLQCFAGAKALAMEMQAPSATLMGIGYSAMIDAALGETP